MRYVEAPENYLEGGDAVTVFLAGGITGCEDWQFQMARLLSHTELVVFNPRRVNFPINDLTAADAQIQWEREHLYRADRILFWFPNCLTSVCPIALFELGYWLHSDKPLAIGVEPGYAREVDVYAQTELARPDIDIVDNLTDLSRAIR